VISLTQKIKNAKVNDEAAGEVSAAGDGVVWIKGLPEAMFGEVVSIGASRALIMNLEEDKIGAVILGGYEEVSRGNMVNLTRDTLKIGAGKDLLGRVINPLGEYLDGKGDYKVDKLMPVERTAPGIVDRQSVDTSLLTGILAVDAMIPIGRGQRQLIIGDRGTGKSALAVDTIINQKDQSVISIYVAIGQKRGKVAAVIEKFEEFDALKNTIVVAATASDSASLRYIAPYVGTAIGEYFMEKGQDVLIVYDDLTKHAWSYRELSLLLRRPSGREAYPGDVFYLHSRLLERACRLNKKNGGGSLTALPIIETQAGDVSAYIPTNVISITDGQIYLEPDLFFAGVKPALNVGLSVSRVGGAAQSKPMKRVAGKLRLELSQYWELATFAQFAADTDAATKDKIERGKRVVEILKQPQYSPIGMAEQVVTIFLANSGVFDDIEVQLVTEFRAELMNKIKNKFKKTLTDIARKEDFSEEDQNEILAEANKLKENFVKTRGTNESETN